MELDITGNNWLHDVKRFQFLTWKLANMYHQLTDLLFLGSNLSLIREVLRFTSSTIRSILARGTHKVPVWRYCLYLTHLHFYKNWKERKKWVTVSFQKQKNDKERMKDTQVPSLWIISAITKKKKKKKNPELIQVKSCIFRSTATSSEERQHDIVTSTFVSTAMLVFLNIELFAHKSKHTHICKKQWFNTKLRAYGNL